jgi:uncharacterized protein YkwD
MLHKYDILKSMLMMAFAAAGGVAVSGPSAAASGACSLDKGYSISLATYLAEASACVDEAKNLDAAVADGLVAEVNAERVARGLAPLNRRASLDMAAAAHALDMSAREYAAHADPEGRDHLHRIRTFDRTMLVGASGANVAMVRASDGTGEVHKSIIGDPLNQENMLRSSFTDVGVAVVENAGQYYVVQVFAAAEGNLERAMPVNATKAQALRASLTDRDLQVVAWGLSDARSGEMLARSTIPRVSFSTIRGTETAYLDVLVTERDNTYVLKGPLVSGH